MGGISIAKVFDPLGLFTKSKVPEPAALPPPVARDDPAVAAAKEKLRLSELTRRGRAASILTSAGGVSDDDLGSTGSTGGTQPADRGAKLLGGSA